MFNIFKNNSRNKLRDINIAIDYHNTGKTLKQVGNKYGLDSERIRQIVHNQTRNVLHQVEKYLGIYVGSSLKKEHCEASAEYLKLYKNFLIENGIDK